MHVVQNGMLQSEDLTVMHVVECDACDVCMYVMHVVQNGV